MAMRLIFTWVIAALITMTRISAVFSEVQPSKAFSPEMQAKFDRTDRAETEMCQADLPIAQEIWEKRLKPEERTDAHMVSVVKRAAIRNDARGRKESLSDPAGGQQYFNVADKCYALWVNLKPDDSDAYSEWADTLNNQAVGIFTTDPGSAREFWRQSGEKFLLAVSMTVVLPEMVLRRWGEVLDQQARREVKASPDFAKDLWRQSDEKFAAAAANVEAFFRESHRKSQLGGDEDLQVEYMWGKVLLDKAQSLAEVDFPEAHASWEQARRHFSHLVQVQYIYRFEQGARGIAESYWREAQLQAKYHVPATPEFWLAGARWYARVLARQLDSANGPGQDRPGTLAVWGTLDGARAKAIANLNPSEAREAWRLAELRMSQSFALSPQEPVVLCTYGDLLAAEADVVSPIESDHAQTLRRRALGFYVVEDSSQPDVTCGKRGIASLNASNNIGEPIIYSPDKRERTIILATGYDEEARELGPEDWEFSDRLWTQAERRFEEASAMLPSDSRAVDDWTRELLAHARSRDWPGAAALLTKSMELREKFGLPPL